MKKRLKVLSVILSSVSDKITVFVIPVYGKPVIGKRFVHRVGKIVKRIYERSVKIEDSKFYHIFLFILSILYYPL